MDRSEWIDWTDQKLIDFEISLYEEEVAGDDNWALREAVLREMDYRGLMDRNPEQTLKTP